MYYRCATTSALWLPNMAPFVLKFKGNKSFSPLSQISDAEALTRTWKVCTKVASHLEQGQRLENLSWRLWFLQIALVQADNAKQKREFKKFSKGMGEKLDKDKGRSIHELQAPGFKRTDSTDKVRMRVGEMAQHRESGTLPPHLSANAAGANGLTNRDANYMKGMQYTFAVDPRVKPLSTTPSMDAGAGRGGGVMGKMRVKPMGMHPPPVPAKALKQQQQQQQQQAGLQNQAQKNEVGKDGDTTMHAVVKNEHAMDVSEDHASAEDDSMQHDANHAATSVEQDDQLYSRHEEDDGEGTGHHTPTQHHMLPSHHPSALPYPPPPSTGPAAHALSNAFTGNSYSNGYNNTSYNGSGGNSYGRAQHGGGSGSTQQAQPQHQAPPQPNIIRFPTIFSSDFGPTALLCAVPTANAPAVAPHFSFESLGSPSPSEVGMFQSFAALGNTLDGMTTIQSNVTTQGIYGPGGPPSASSTSGTGSNSFARGAGVGNAGGYTSGSTGGSSGHPGIGIGMQTSGTGFDFGVPRPTFEFPIDDILKGELGEGDGAQGASTTGATSGADATMGWDTSNDMFSFVTGSAAAWGVQPAEIHSPGGTPANGVNSSTMNQSVPLVTSPTRRAFSGHPTSARSPATNAYSAQIQSHQQQQQQQAVGQQTPHQAKANNTSPVSMSSGGVKGEGYDGSPTSGQGAVAQSPQSVSGSTPSSMVSPAPSSAPMIATATPGGTVAGTAAGSVVPGNVGNTAPGGVKSECANCGATHTPLWRRGLNDELNCNACGLYCKLHKRARPKNLRTSHGDRAGNAWGTKTGETEMVGEPVQCHNCATMATPLWRKDDEGNTLCNACGLYLKLHGTRRPLSMKSDVIRKRSRHETEKRTSVSSIITVMTPSSNPQNSRRNSPTPPPSAGSSSSGPEQYVGGSSSASGVDPMLFPYEQDFTFSNETDYLSMGMGFGNDLSFTSFGYNNLQESSSSNASNNAMTRNGLASPRSPTEVQHIVETTVTAGIENGGGHSAPNAKRRRMTIESSFSGSSFAHTTGGANSTHSSPTGLGQKGPNTSPPFFSLDATLNNVNNSSNAGNAGDQSNGAASPTRSTFGTSSPGQVGLTYDFYGYPIHPPLVPLHPPNLMHPHSTMWETSTLQHTPTQSSMNRARSQSHSHSPSHSRSGSTSHSRSNSQHITMPLYLYDGGASSRAYETHNAPTPTGGSGANVFDSTEEELFNNLFGESMEDKRVHYGPTGGM